MCMGMLNFAPAALLATLAERRAGQERQTSSLVRGARFHCPWCSFNTPYAHGLMGHITKMHSGEHIDQRAAALSSGGPTRYRTASIPCCVVRSL